ncbi:MAG: type I-MYXAN CRISPR-associated protein Cas6/Cmx6 [Rhodocyclaceae bacterium]|nr:type I-MYXAN CRISPR-associated protein Cas6/Cmx6 [Rhodocyclaceae bacterium]
MSAPLDIVDMQFVLRGRAVPFDYADALWLVLREALPWLETETLAGIHPLYGLSPGGGEWYLSGRSHLNLRLPRDRVTAAEALIGSRLSLSGSAIEIGAATVRQLAAVPVLYAKFVTLGLAESGAGGPDEKDFYTACLQQLAALGMAPRSSSIICGKRQSARTEAGVLHGFSMMVSGLEAEANLRLQQHGLGRERMRGCGVFIQHKSMASVGTLE